MAAVLRGGRPGAGPAPSAGPGGPAPAVLGHCGLRRSLGRGRGLAVGAPWERVGGLRRDSGAEKKALRARPRSRHSYKGLKEKAAFI